MFEFSLIDNRWRLADLVYKHIEAFGCYNKHRIRSCFTNKKLYCSKLSFFECRTLNKNKINVSRLIKILWCKTP